MPVMFVGHGSPLNALEDNSWSRGWRALGASLPSPRAILAVSAHWFVRGTYITGNDAPETIHDFGGFPRPLYEVRYPARGDADLARHVTHALAGTRPASLRDDWGLDHGTWSVLVHLRPQADLPVLQLSIDATLSPAEHLAIGRALASLRDEGVLVLASGNVTHNLAAFFAAYRRGDSSTPPWATSFDADLVKALEQRDTAFLLHALERDDGRMAHPTPDHWLPLLYAAGASRADDEVTFPVQGFEGSLSMRAVRWG